MKKLISLMKHYRAISLCISILGNMVVAEQHQLIDVATIHRHENKNDNPESLLFTIGVAAASLLISKKTQNPLSGACFSMGCRYICYGDNDIEERDMDNFQTTFKNTIIQHSPQLRNYYMPDIIAVSARIALEYLTNHKDRIKYALAGTVGEITTAILLQEVAKKNINYSNTADSYDSFYENVSLAGNYGGKALIAYANVQDEKAKEYTARFVTEASINHILDKKLGWNSCTRSVLRRCISRVVVPAKSEKSYVVISRELQNRNTNNLANG